MPYNTENVYLLHLPLFETLSTVPTRKVQLLFGLETYTSDRMATRLQKMVVKAATRVQMKIK